MQFDLANDEVRIHSLSRLIERVSKPSITLDPSGLIVITGGKNKASG